MKTILVPTDFSKHAENALLFAIVLAKKQNAKIILMNVFRLPVSAAPVPYSLLNFEKEEMQKNVEEKLKSLSIKIENAGGITYECIAEEGSAANTILQTIEKKKPDLVVMGTKGETGLAEIIFGSTATAVIEKAICPVMAIPETAGFNKPIRKITYATNYRANDIDSIKKLMEIVLPLKAELNILHISTEATTEEDGEKLMKDFSSKVNKEIKYPNLTFRVMHGQNIEGQLEKFIEDGNADMIVLSTHHRNFIDRLFGKSITKKIALDTKIPLIAFHANKEVEVV